MVHDCHKLITVVTTRQGNGRLLRATKLLIFSSVIVAFGEPSDCTPTGRIAVPHYHYDLEEKN